VVVHLAFSLMGEGDQTRAINVDGSRTVFEAAAQAKVQRICYASSVAAYGFHDDNPTWLTEDIPVRGTPEHFYSAQKAEVETILDTLLENRETVAYVFRPCIVAGPRAQNLLDEMPYYRLSDAMPDAVRGLLSNMPILRPVIPDPGTPFQLVHEDDVASAFAAGVAGRGKPGAYNLAGNGKLSMKDLADELGWYSIPVPDVAVSATAEIVDRLPIAGEAASWVHAVRTPVLLKTDRAKKSLRWKPKYTGRQTLKELVAARRERPVASD
jgi:nucleoside-diphosphate-sugar epimerase